MTNNTRTAVLDQEALSALQILKDKGFSTMQVECAYTALCRADLFDGITEMDGNMFCAKRQDFENLQESNAGFGETRELAIKDLEERENA